MKTNDVTDVDKAVSSIDPISIVCSSICIISSLSLHKHTNINDTNGDAHMIQ